MGLTSSTSLSKIRENVVLHKFVGTVPVPENDGFWKELLTFSYSPPKSMYVPYVACSYSERRVTCLVHVLCELVTHNPSLETMHGALAR